MPTRYFYDTEFLEDGRTIELISIGIVADDGREYYAVSSDMPVSRIESHDWLIRNVVGTLPRRSEGNLANYIDNGPNSFPRPWFSLNLDTADARVKPHWVIANEVRDFLTGGESPAELWAWYGAYDHVALMQLWGTAISRPEGVPMWTNDLRQETNRLGNPRLPDQPSGHHNALDDARHLRDRFAFVSAGSPTPRGETT